MPAGVGWRGLLRRTCDAPSRCAYSADPITPRRLLLRATLIRGSRSCWFHSGVGAIYNGQYAKGLVHAIVLRLLISIINSRSANGLEPLFGILIAAFVLYMAFEAHHTARRRNAVRPWMSSPACLLIRARGARAAALLP
jgi:hypothetical protein